MGKELWIAAAIITASRLTMPSAIADDIDATSFHQMQIEQSLDRQAAAQEDQAGSQRRSADALERIANHGFTDAEIKEMRSQQQMQDAMQAQREAQFVKTNGPTAVRQYQAEVDGYVMSRFASWLQMQSIPALSEVLNVHRKTNYVDSLTKEHIAVEPEKEFMIRLKGEARPYFQEHYLFNDDMYADWQNNIFSMQQAVAGGQMPSAQVTHFPDGLSPEEGEIWSKLQWFYPGVKVMDLWRPAAEEAKKSMPANATMDQIIHAAYPVFQKRAVPLILVTAPSTQPNPTRLN